MLADTQPVMSPRACATELLPFAHLKSLDISTNLVGSTSMGKKALPPFFGQLTALAALDLACNYREFWFLVPAAAQWRLLQEPPEAPSLNDSTSTRVPLAASCRPTMPRGSALRRFQACVNVLDCLGL